MINTHDRDEGFVVSYFSGARVRRRTEEKRFTGSADPRRMCRWSGWKMGG